MAMQDEALGSLKIDFGHYIDVLKRGTFKIAFLTCLFLLIGLSLASFWPSTYEATTKVALKEFKIIDDNDLFKSTAQLPVPQKNQVLQSYLTSRSYVQAVLEQLDWVEYYESNSDPASRTKFLNRVASHIVPSVKTDITGSSLVEIDFTWTSPTQARDFVGRLRDYWIDQILESYKRTHKEQLVQMETLLAAHQNDSRNAQEQLDDFQATHSLPLDLTQDYKLNLQKQLTSSITALEAEITGSEQKLKSLEEALSQTPKDKETKVQAANPDYVVAQNKVLAAQKLIDGYKSKGYTPKHPHYQRANMELQSSLDELEGLKKFIEDQVTTEPNPDYNKFYQDYVVGKADHEGKLKVLKQQKSQLADVEKEIKDLPVLQNELERLKNEV